MALTGTEATGDAVKVLVTGGAGFIGSTIVDLLVERGHDVVALDCFHPCAHDGKPDYLNPEARWIEADLASPEDAHHLADALDGVDVVSHQASMVGLGTSFDDVERYVRDNSLGTAALLRAMAAGPGVSRLVLASSCVVYGEQTYRCDTHGVVAAPPRDATLLEAGRFDPLCPHCEATLEAVPVVESAPLDPRNVYAITKVNQEHLVGAFARETDTPVLSLRYHNVYGPRMPCDTPYAGVASIFRSALEGGRAPRVFEDGRQRRDFVHVRDVARANLAALEAPAEVTGAANVASGQPHTVGEMATALAAAFGSGRLRPEVTGEYRLGDVRHIVCSPERAERVLGWTATTSFADGMAELAVAPLRTTTGRE